MHVCTRNLPIMPLGVLAGTWSYVSLHHLATQWEGCVHMNTFHIPLQTPTLATQGLLWQCLGITCRYRLYSCYRPDHSSTQSLLEIVSLGGVHLRSCRMAPWNEGACFRLDHHSYPLSSLLARASQSAQLPTGFSSLARSCPHVTCMSTTTRGQGVKGQGDAKRICFPYQEWGVAIKHLFTHLLWRFCAPWTLSSPSTHIHTHAEPVQWQRMHRRTHA